MKISRLNLFHSIRAGFAVGAAALLLAACSADGPGTVTTPVAPTVSLSASPAVGSIGGSSALVWSSTNASACIASGAWSGGRATGGNETSGSYTASGTYSYVLTCTGAGGSGSATATVMVGTVAAPLVTIAANPASIAPGESATINWSSANATSCTASGNWSGSQNTAGNFDTGAVSATGSYDYTLTCTGPGGTGSGTATLTVSQTPAPTVSLTATPDQVANGGDSILTWSSTDATSCTASGAWSGARDTANATGEDTGALTATGVNSYTLTCSGPGGSAAATATVTVGAPPAPTVTISVDPTSIAAGDSATLSWSSTDATDCTASGSWSGDQPVSGTYSTGTLDTAGIYSYTLSCTGPGGTTANSAMLTVTSTGTPVSNCGIGIPANALLAPDYAASSSVSSSCIGCTVDSPDNVTDADLTGTAATISTPLNLVGNASLTVTGGTVLAAGSTAGFLIQSPGEVLTLGLLQNVTVQTLLNGTVQETASSNGSAPIVLDLLRLLQSGNPSFLSFQTTMPFDSLRLTDANAVGLLGNLNVYLACVSAQ